MAETKPRVMDMVRRELARDPSQSSEALYEKAKKVDRSIGSLSIRQFHARYPLQVKRIEAAERRRGGRKPGGRKAAARKGGARKAGARKGRPRKKTTAKKSAAKKSAAKKTTRRARKAGRPAAQKSTGGRKQATGKATRRRASSGGGDNNVRAVLIEFAQEIAAAEGKADVIGVVGRIDAWAERIRNLST